MLTDSHCCCWYFSGSTVRAQPTKNKFAFAKHPFTERLRGRPGHVVPLNVFDVSTVVTDEVMVTRALCVKPCGAAFDSHFTHQSRLNQVPKIVVSRRPG